jgi:hypothetical protein
MWVSRRWGGRDQLEDRVVFEAWRKPVDVEPVLKAEVPATDPFLRDEVDPDPLIEEMVARLRDGLSNLHAVDEWGRPLAWRNVVRLALGPMAGRLRDTEQALELAVSMIPVNEEAAERRVEERRVEERRSEPAEAAASVEPTEDVEEPQATVDVILPAAEAVSDVPVEVAGHVILVEEPIVVDVPEESDETPEPEEPQAVEEPAAPSAAAAPVEAAPAAVPAPAPPVLRVVPASGAASIFTISGDQRAVPVSPLSPGKLLGGSGTDDSTTAKYDRFLTGLYGERKQMGGDQDGGAGSPGLGH